MTGSITSLLSPVNDSRMSSQIVAQVVDQVLAGQTALFEVLMRRHNERVYRAARAIVRDEREAEDVMQQAYVNAFAHLRQFHGSAQFSTWLTRITINEAIARMRRRGRYEVFDETRPGVEPFMSHDPSENPERQAFTGELRGLLEHPHHRQGFGLDGITLESTDGYLQVYSDLMRK